ncbi:hypothetical protein [Polynucleobacter brandtiae]|uniref:Uncharacterized protein n=1 Tax=Polynucleobacter brandtiae TaxID=1938816 RepID=A0A2M8VIK4_9BURK|nr:hypothetical protein [Polynucleobacter brandtiae]PJI76683.1 hypothetical protein B0G85_1887 [Polynucleobacter brandtiae]
MITIYGVRRISLILLAIALEGIPFAWSQNDLQASSTKTLPINPPQYSSAFNGYQSYLEQKITPWNQANAVVENIGGWRAYARESTKLEAQEPIQNSSKSLERVK